MTRFGAGGSGDGSGDGGDVYLTINLHMTLLFSIMACGSGAEVTR